MNEMTAEKAIENLQGIKSARFATMTENTGELYEKIVIGDLDSLDMALTALERQVPKEVDESSLNYSNLPVSKCPICASSGISPYKDRYCFNCGQALKFAEVRK